MKINVEVMVNQIGIQLQPQAVFVQRDILDVPWLGQSNDDSYSWTLYDIINTTLCMMMY